MGSAAHRRVVVLRFGLVLASLLEAEGLRKQAQIQPQGFSGRRARRHASRSSRFSRALHLTTPRHELQEAIGRENEDQIDTQVHLSLPPPATTPPTSRRAEAATGRRTGQAALLRSETVESLGRRRLARRGAGRGARAARRRVDVVGVESRLSTGLARTDLYNWYTRIQQAPRQLHPHVVVLSFGADDAHDYMAACRRQVGRPLGSPSWIAEYRRRVDGVTRELNAAGIYVVWLGLPIPDGPGFKKSFPVVNAILEGVAHAHAKDATYVDTWHLLDDSHGRYTPYLRVHGKLTQIRLPTACTTRRPGATSWQRRWSRASERGTA